MPTTPLKRPDVALFAELSAIDRLAAIHMERLMPGGLTTAQFNVLTRLATHGRQTPGELAAAQALSKPAMSHALARLESAGLAQIEADASDGRRRQVSITRAGEEAYRDGSVALSPMLRALRVSFAPDEFEAALPFLSRLRAWLQAGGQDQPA
jgi:DNA-binding MarR family transcriptional regulator